MKICLRHFAFALLLGLSVLIGQHAAIQHDVGHALGQLQEGDSLPAPAKCGDHALYVSLGSALAGDSSAAPFVAAVIPAPAAIAIRRASLPVRHSFLSRAPPAASPA